MMPFGTYFIGDLYYCMHEVWHEFCKLTIDENNNCLDGEFNLSDGRRFATFQTKYGDGCYESNKCTKHPVDAGLIGCIKVFDIKDPKADTSLGAIFYFDEPFITSSKDGIIYFDDISIDTN